MGRYASLADLKELCGTANVAAWADLENDETVNTDSVAENAIAAAEAYIDERLTGSSYIVPLQLGSGGVYVVRRMVCLLAGCQLYGKRGLQDDKQLLPDKLAGWREEVYQQIVGYLSGAIRLDASRHPIPSGPVVV